MQPILLNSCARAATADEARYRIQAPVAPARGVRVLALDPAAAAVLARIAQQPWAAARFYTGTGPDRLHRISPPAGGGPAGGGSGSSLAAVLEGADLVVMVATAADRSGQAAHVGAACTGRGITTAGLALGGGGGPGGGGPGGDAGPAGAARRAAVASLRPYARVILATDDEDDLAAVLTALRA
jgi:hypothetical protein